MTLAHFGLAITVAGVTGAGLWQVEGIQIMRPGDKVNISGYEFTFKGAETIRGPNYAAERGNFTIREDGQFVADLSGERRRYLVSGDETTEAGIYTTFMYDLYAVLGEPNGRGGWTTRLYYKPLVPWLWFGSIIMVLGGIVSLTDRRLRIGAPSRRSSRAAMVPAE